LKTPKRGSSAQPQSSRFVAWPTGKRSHDRRQGRQALDPKAYPVQDAEAHRLIRAMLSRHGKITKYEFAALWPDDYLKSQAGREFREAMRRALFD
jgi:hypothetical protein